MGLGHRASNMNNLPDPIDLNLYRQQKKNLDDLLPSVTKMSHPELCQFTQLMSKVIDQQSELLVYLVANQQQFVEKFKQIQGQFLYVSGQAYLSLEILKDKGVISPEEVESMWQGVLQDKILDNSERESDNSSSNS